MNLTKFNGSNPEGAQVIAEKLELLRADLATYESNIRGLRYDPKLRPFLDVSRKIQILDQFARQHSDLVSERLTNLGVSPLEVPSTLPALSRVPALAGAYRADDAMAAIVQTSLRLMETVREVFYVAADYNDAATLSVLSHIARQISIAIHIFHHERLALMN